MDENEVKTMIRSVLTSHPLSLNILQMCDDYRSLVGESIPFKHFGYSSVENFLRSIPDTVVVKGSGMRAELVVVTGKSAHIGAMVERQKINPRKRGSSMKRCKMVLSDTSYIQRSLGVKKAQQNQNVSKVDGKHTNNTIRRGSFSFDKQLQIQTSPKFNSNHSCEERSPDSRKSQKIQISPQINSNNTIVERSSSINTTSPQIDRYANCTNGEQSFGLDKIGESESSSKFEAITPVVNDFSTTFKNSLNDFNNVQSPPMNLNQTIVSITKPNLQKESQKPKQSKVVKINESYKYKHYTNFRIKHDAPIPLSEKLKLVEVKDEFPLKNTNVPKHIQRSLKELVEGCPNGILCTRIPALFRKKFRKDLKYERYRYTSLIELLSSLPHLVEYKAAGRADYLVFKVGTKVPDYVEPHPENNVVETKSAPKRAVWEQTFDPKSDWSVLPIKVPEDVLRFGDKLSIYFDRGWKIGDTLHIQMGEIFDLSKFWIAIETNLDKLMKDLQLFFTCRNSSEYSIPRILLRVNLYCVAFYLKYYHRCYVLDLLKHTPDYILVYFIDYGTTDFVAIKNCYYLPKEFAEIPCQAIRARLSNVMPPIENDVWSVQAIERFARLTRNTQLVAEIIEIEEDNILEIYLADVLVESAIFFINEVLIDEGHAVYAHQERIKPLFEDPDCIPLVKYLHLYPNFQDLEDGSFQRNMNYIQMNNIPAHHYMPTYFHITLPGDQEDLKKIEKAFEMRNKPMSNLKISALEYEYDDSYLNELEEYLDEEENADIEEKVEISSAAKRRAHLMSLELPEESTSSSIPDGSTHSSLLVDDALNVKKEPLSPSYSAESTFSEQIENSTNRQFMSNLNNVQSLSPYVIDKNPFRSTNPFLEDLESTISTNQLLNRSNKADLIDSLKKLDIENTPIETDLLLNTPIKQNSLYVGDMTNTESKELGNETGVVKGTQTEVKRISTPPGFPSKLPSNPPPSRVGLNCNAAHNVSNVPSSTSTLNYNAPQYLPTNLLSTSGFNYDHLLSAAPGRNFDASQFIPDNNALTQAIQYTALVDQLKMMHLYNYNIQPQYSPQNYQLLQAMAAMQNGYPGDWQGVAGALPPVFYPPGRR